MSTPDSARILGVPVHAVTLAEAVETIRGFARSGGAHQVATVNPEFVAKAQEDREFLRVLNETSLSVPDGIGIVLAGRILGRRFAERVTGVDLMENLAAVAARDGFRLFLLGAAPGVAEKAANNLVERHPGLAIAGVFAGSPRREDEDAIVRRVRDARTDILFVAYGAPQQDLWISRNAARAGVGAAMGVGGSFDFIAGVSRRAPAWAQRLGVEWLYRLVQEPWRWKRMIALPRFAAGVVRQRLAGGAPRRGRGGQGAITGNGA
jgi:N-acetylglucosaminyldiphosphoundecaprenol N-acetyl-beta-D-mannosaminyltransferase